MFFVDAFFLQIIILYIIFNIFFLDHSFYYLSYFFFFLLWLGLLLSYLELDTFAAILWIVELSIIVVFFLYFLFISNMFQSLRYNIKIRYFNIFIVILPSFFLLYNQICSNYWSFSYFNKYHSLNWKNYYELLNSSLLNDFFVLFFLYLNINFLEFIFLGILISFGCILTVALYLLIKELNSYQDFIHYINFKKFSKNYKFSYKRHQCFYKQEYRMPSIRITKKPF